MSCRRASARTRLFPLAALIIGEQQQQQGEGEDALSLLWRERKVFASAREAIWRLRAALLSGCAQCRVIKMGCESRCLRIFGGDSRYVFRREVLFDSHFMSAQFNDYCSRCCKIYTAHCFFHAGIVFI